MDAASLLMAAGLTLGSVTIPWSIVILVAVVVVGLLLIRTAITLVKVAILVAVGLGIFLLVQYVLHNFS